MDEVYVVEVKIKDEHGCRMWTCEVFTEMEQAIACCAYLNAKVTYDDVNYFWYPVKLCKIDYASLMKQS